jgi:hypothetical protein
MRRRLTDVEGIIGRDRGLLFLDAADIAPTRAEVEEAGEFGELGCGADGVDFDAAIVEIAGIPGEAELDGGALGKVAIPDTLDAAADDPAPCFGGAAFRFAHRGQLIV